MIIKIARRNPNFFYSNLSIKSTTSFKAELNI